MSEKKEVTQELIRLPKMLNIPQRFATGEAMGRFLSELRDNKRLMANVCPKCGRKQIPPREVCAECRVEATDWVEVGPEGTIVTVDIIYYASPDPLTGESRNVPYNSCRILLDGCKGFETFWHECIETDPEKIKAGTRVRPKWAENRKGDITDIEYFEVIE